MFSQILADRIEPALRSLGPVFLYDFPAPLAALARCKEETPEIADRFELYLAGIELANAFGELTDPLEQMSRFRQEQNERRIMGREVYPIDMRFIDALREGIPPAAGIAMGVDRLLMVLSGAQRVDEVVAFPPAEV